MVFQIRQVSNHGTANPIVARLAIQTKDLMQFCNVGDELKQKVFGLYQSEIQWRVLECDDLAKEIVKDISEISKEVDGHGFTTQSSGKVISVPCVIRLNQRIEQFLYSEKSALRDLAKIFALFFGKKFTEARYDKILTWANKEFGEKSDLSKTIKSNHDAWIKQTISMRNAVEHPDGHSGPLVINNFELVPKSDLDYPRLKVPSWHLNNQEESPIEIDLPIIVSALLEFSERLLVECMRQKGWPSLLCISEIPESDRDPSCAVRLKMVLASEKM